MNNVMNGVILNMLNWDFGERELLTKLYHSNALIEGEYIEVYMGNLIIINNCKNVRKKMENDHLISPTLYYV